MIKVIVRKISNGRRSSPAMGDALPFALLLLLLQSCRVSSQPFNVVRWNEFVQKIEGQAVDLAREVERLYSDRCNSIWLSDCTRSNYDGCSSSYDQPVCLDAGETFFVEECGNATGSAEFDYSCSTVRIPADANGPDGNPTDSQIIETICFTRDLDTWFMRTSENQRESWEEFGVGPWSMYFGSQTGAFRIYPARRSYECGAFDPRTRPWYVAASSGPKNVVLILDTSGSMQGMRLELMKEAAKRVVRTLTVGDRVAIIPFNEEVRNPMVDGNGEMYVATDEAKEILYEQIDALTARGKRNFLGAFKAAFSVLDKSIDQEIVVECYTAILFLTDGKMTDPENVSEQAVIDEVSGRIDEVSAAIGKPVLLFTNSISEEDGEEAHRFPSNLACSTEYGVWSKIASDDEIVDIFSSYYLLFALGLGSDRNEDFVAWVEPYQYSTGGILGTTVSVPVYDRTKDPHLFLGVVGVDIDMLALVNAMEVNGTEGGTEDAIEQVAARSMARCPALNLTLCEMESYRSQGVAGDDAMCTGDCAPADLVQVEEERCPAITDYPRDLWINTDHADVPYENSTCCDNGVGGGGGDPDVEEKETTPSSGFRPFPRRRIITVMGRRLDAAFGTPAVLFAALASFSVLYF